MSVYEPAEDTWLMSEALKVKLPKILKINKNLKFLEVGCGSGVNLQTALESGVKKENILGSDINPKAVGHCKNLGFRCIKSDLFKVIKGKFDVIVFNPPYLPEDNLEPRSSRRETTAGKKGNEIIIKFLKQAGKHLKDNGKIFLITSSLSQKVDFESLGYNAKAVGEKKMFFEALSCWELSVK